MIFTEVFDKFIEILDQFLAKNPLVLDDQIGLTNFENDMNFLYKEIKSLELGECGRAFMNKVQNHLKNRGQEEDEYEEEEEESEEEQE